MPRPAAAGLVSTVDDYLAFGRMMLNGGRHGTQRILARPTVEADDHRSAHAGAEGGLAVLSRASGTTAAGASASSMITRRDDIAAVPGRFGWDGGFGTSWASDPHEDLVGVLMVQRLFDPVVVAISSRFLDARLPGDRRLKLRSAAAGTFLGTVALS